MHRTRQFSPSIQILPISAPCHAPSHFVRGMPYTRVNPTNMTVARAKQIIDYTATHGTNKRYSKAKRIGNGVCLTICCSPCFIWSTVVRAVSCPFQCMFNSKVGCNPLAALLRDSCITTKSDECISTGFDSLDEKLVVVTMENNHDNFEIILYAAAKIRATTDKRIWYAIADAMQPIMRTVTYTTCVSPNTILKAAESVAPPTTQTEEPSS